MFHVKHNNKDNILHVYIGDRTRMHAQADTGQAGAHLGRRRHPRYSHRPLRPRQRTSNPSAGKCTNTGKAGDRARKLAIGGLSYVYFSCIYIEGTSYICRLSYMYFSYIYKVCEIPTFISVWLWYTPRPPTAPSGPRITSC